MLLLYYLHPHPGTKVELPHVDPQQLASMKTNKAKTKLHSANMFPYRSPGLTPGSIWPRAGGATRTLMESEVASSSQRVLPLAAVGAELVAQALAVCE
jgi:hypothetical protein